MPPHESSSVIDEQGNPIRIEVGYYRHFGQYLHEADSIEGALSFIEYGEDAGHISSVGVFVDGDPRIWDGYCDKEPPTPEQAEQMRTFYREATDASL